MSTPQDQTPQFLSAFELVLFELDHDRESALRYSRRSQPTTEQHMMDLVKKMNLDLVDQSRAKFWDWRRRQE